MNASSTSITSQDFLHQLVLGLIDAIEVGTKNAYRMFWSYARDFFPEHWLLILSFVFAIFLIAVGKAMLGRWGSLGSLLYNLFYFGFILIVILIWGTDVLTNNYFNAFCAAILYPVCYLLVGKVLDVAGFRNRK